ncbi:MAG: ABC transporter ATP-binding protein [Firmicutes bacterium]|nr:ABC transporter ATP-binding protein [Bacillota bacterium]
MAKQLLQVSNLETRLTIGNSSFLAVDAISFAIDAGETVALVGESGCGKSLTALSIMGLVPNPPGQVVGGEVLLAGSDLLQKSEREMQAIRGKQIAMIFQEPMTSLNPLLRIGEQLTEGICLHEGISRSAAWQKGIELLRLVGISAPERRMREYPHQLSGGMRQRVMIAIALACGPQLLIADEPTTALDVTIQAQILQLMRELQERLATALLLITHDLGVVAAMADRVLVMYLGRIVESAPVEQIFTQPAHPYTAGLLASMPKLKRRTRRLQQISGIVPSPLNKPSGCRFHDRCAYATDRCRAVEPAMQTVGEKQEVACWYPFVAREGGVKYEHAVATD